MRPFYLLIGFLILSSIPSLNAQNYLRVSDPDNWNVPITSTPDWHMYRDHGQFDEITIVTEPQGIYTEIELYATISQGDASSWSGEFEIVWQFDLPSKSIVHDSWLWIGSDIVKADVVDYWTALQTYEEIVDRNEDPSFFYRLSDNRYEIRIYPLFEGESRRIKMSFLVPTQWDLEEVKTDLLNNMLQSTDLIPSTIALGMLVDDQWTTPKFQIDNQVVPMTDTVVNGAGAMMHYIEWPADEFVAAEETQLVVDAPFSSDNIFLSTFSEGGDNFYQMAFVPDWIEALPDSVVPLGIIDYTTTLENGIAYQRYSISDPELNAQNNGVILQTGKYLGDFPMHVNANLITDGGEFYNMTNSIDVPNIMEGDTLMREMWYGSYLRELKILAGSDEDRLAIIEQSIEERVLTGLTAFLALEPSQGGEPCIGCLLNSGDIFVIDVVDDFIVSEASFMATPNPASDYARVRLEYTNTLSAKDWTAGIYDISGRLVKTLDTATEDSNVLEWNWEIGPKVSGGVYFCKIQSSHGELTTKIIVLP